MSGREVSKDEFDAWVAAFPRKLSTMFWATTDSIAYHDLERVPPDAFGGWKVESEVATINVYMDPERQYYVHDDLIFKDEREEVHQMTNHQKNPKP